MAQSLTVFLVSLVLAVALSRTFRRSLFWLYSRERKPGKEKIHRLFPKPRRPLGGGLAIMAAATASALLVPLAWGRLPDPDALWALPVAWAFALIGLVDDLRKAAGRGLRERAKFLLQLAAALLFALLLWGLGGRSDVQVPFVAQPLDFGVLFVLFAALVLVATANAVNLSDGIDGLAAGAVAIALAGLAALGYLDPGRAVGPTCWPFVGAALGFLVFNFPPARLLMGDTGALGLGAALGALAILGRAEFLLLLLGAPFVVNAASVLVQMGTVRGLWRIVKPLRHHRSETARPFLCTPLHHHFQWLAWSDLRILALYWGFGALLAAWSLPALSSDLLWLLGLLTIPAFLLAALFQKLLSGHYFIGLLERPDQAPVVALYRGLPLDILGWRLHRKVSETTITERMLVGATAESILWRPISEVEAHVILGKIYADQRLLDEALTEWEQVPTRNLLLRPSVVLRLARIYYGRDRLLEAIRLWEQMPGSRLAEMPNLREVVRSAKLRLVDLASKSHRQGMRSFQRAERTGEPPERLETYLATGRRYNRELLSLLIYERDKLRGRSAHPQATRSRRELLRRTRDVVLARIQEVDEALAQLARTTPAPAEAVSETGDPAQRAASDLNLPREDLLDLLSQAGDGLPEITQAAVHPKASRNTVYRLNLAWPTTGPRSVIAKLYASDRISFFSACYRREQGVLKLLRQYGAAVPRVYAGELREDRAVLIMQDLGDETLAERLEASDAAVRRHRLRSAVSTLVTLHSTAQGHLRELTTEIRKINKETLVPQYYFNALRIAADRIAALADAPITNPEWQQIADQAGPLVDSLAGARRGFIHFEFTPHHLLVTDSGLYVFDFEQATIGPPEFDLAALLAQPESDIGLSGWNEMVEHYAIIATESGLPIPEADQLARGVAYAALFKCLVYAGAAANFLGKFGGEHHLQRLNYYLDRCESIMQHWHPLRPFGQLLAPRFRAARDVIPQDGIPAAQPPPG
ncbi:MAG TPA: phosphotransferase [Armatimonadota bacterium]|nr:phosphotransferase [Armatimonadota bacterium]